MNWIHVLYYVLAYLAGFVSAELFMIHMTRRIKRGVRS